MSARVKANAPAVLVFKVSFHPNWQVFVDGHRQRAFMVSPSFIATEVPAGDHEVRAEYHSDTLKKALMVAAGFVLLVTLLIWALGWETKLNRHQSG